MVGAIRHGEGQTGQLKFVLLLRITTGMNRVSAAVGPVFGKKKTFQKAAEITRGGGILHALRQTSLHYILSSLYIQVITY